MLSKHSLCVQIYLSLLVSLAALADQTAPQHRVPLPDLSKLNLDCDVQAFQNRTVLICFWDYSQRPSRRFIKALIAQHDQLAQLNVPVLLIQTDPQSRESSRTWLDANQIKWPSGTLAENVEACLRDWSVSALPWPILTDRGQIKSMGFSLEQLTKALAVKARLRGASSAASSPSRLDNPPS